MNNSNKIGTHQARKRFGQNFLVDKNIIDLIIKEIKPKQDDNLIEIGAGLGAITAPLLKDCTGLKIIELDRDLVLFLKKKFREYDGCDIQQGNVLEVDFKELAENEQSMRIVGNLPYNITTPLLFHLLSFHEYISDMYFMLQKEVVERISSSPGTKSYGRLSIMVQYYCSVHPLFIVPPSSFAPSPKVDSMMVLLRPHTEIPYAAKNLVFFAKLVRTCFQQRRKTIRNSIKLLLPEKYIKQLNIDLTLRPEKFSVEQFVKLSNQMSELI